MAIRFHHVGLLFILIACAVSSSHYDNLGDDPLPPGQEAAEEVHQRWDFEVYPEVAPLMVLSLT